MAGDRKATKSLSELIDHIERIREELLAVQSSLERLEPFEPKGEDDPISD
jgi:hypothetical protein